MIRTTGGVPISPHGGTATSDTSASLTTLGAVGARKSYRSDNTAQDSARPRRLDQERPRTPRSPNSTNPDARGEDVTAQRVLCDRSGSASWQQFARCAGIDLNVFFPPHGRSVQPAKRICEQCTVRAYCLAHALQRGEIYGVWGGTSEDDRRLLRRAARVLAGASR
jgi:WhiB family redox-sensing transcriptional regulator